MIKKAGNWTTSLINHLYECKKESLLLDELNIENFKEEDVFIELDQLERSLKDQNLIQRNMDLFPEVHVSRPISAPFQSASYRNNLVLVGAGSGIAPFLAFMEEQQRVAQELSKENYEVFREITFNNFDQAHLVFICRENDQLSWISSFLQTIILSKTLNKKIKVHLYLTLKKNAKTLPSFLFWRAIIQSQKLEKKNVLTGGGFEVNLGRPNFGKLFDKVS